MPAEVRVYPDPGTLGEALAEDILELYRASAGRRFVLGCPGGRSLLTTYGALARRQPELRRLQIVMMDEYAGAEAAAHYSCLGFAQRELQGPLSLAGEQIWLPDEDDPEAYDNLIASVGGVALFLLASGASDGHVAFNPPGS